MSTRGAASPRWMSWTGLVYYGETVGFLLAWIVGLATLVFTASDSTPTRPAIEQVAAAEAPTPLEAVELKR